MKIKDFRLNNDLRLAVTYVAYLIYLISSLGSFYLFVSGQLNAFYSLCVMVTSLVGIIYCLIVLMRHEERLREITEVIILKKIKRPLKRLYNRYFKDGYI